MTEIPQHTQERFSELGITEEEWYISDAGIQVKKSGIQKILKSLKINDIESEVVSIINQEVSHKNGGGVSEAVFMKGRRASMQIYFYASATPNNCNFPYKLEMCYNRLVAKIALHYADLGGVYGEDEMDSTSTGTRRKQPLSEAINKLTNS